MEGWIGYVTADNDDDKCKANFHHFNAMGSALEGFCLEGMQRTL